MPSSIQISTTDQHEISVSITEEPTNISATQSNISSQSIQQTNSTWILLSTVLVIILTATPILIHIVIISKEKSHLHTTTVSKNLPTTTSIITATDDLNENTKWKQNGITIAGRKRTFGNDLKHLYHPYGMDMDHTDQSIYIADSGNHRIVKWEYNQKTGQIVAGGNGQGNQTNQLNFPSDVLINKYTNSLIICDRLNERIIEWVLNNSTNGKIILSDIACSTLAMDKQGNIYISDWKENQVIRLDGTVIARQMNQHSIKQQYVPIYIFMDTDYSLYLSDCTNNLVMKWIKGAEEGVIIAGGDNSTELFCPKGLFVDQFSNIYIVDSGHQRIIRWLNDENKVDFIVGGNGFGDKSNQLNSPEDLLFDKQGNLYVVDQYNHRVQKFQIDFK